MQPTILYSTKKRNYFLRTGLFLLLAVSVLFSCEGEQVSEIEDETIDVKEEDYIFVEKPDRKKKPDSIIVGEEEAQVEAGVEEIDASPEFKYNQKGSKIKWIKAAKGLEYAEVDASIKCNIGDSKISVIRISPTHFEFKLLSSKEKGGGIKTIDNWAKEYNLVAAINAGMYRTDYATSTGFMKNFDFINNPVLHKEYNLVTAFNPKRDSLPNFQIVDLECQNWEELKTQYHCYTQCLRMIDCDRDNKWSKQEKYWSIAAISEDESGNALFLFSRTPYSVHDFNNILLELPLNITKTMYLEGGPEASIYLDYEKHQMKKMGSYETAFRENDLNKEYWAIPNVIGVVKR